KKLPRNPAVFAMTNRASRSPKYLSSRRLPGDQRGSSYVEYMAITAVVGVVVLGAYSGSSDAIGDSLVEKSLKMLGVSSSDSQGGEDTSAASRESAAQWDETMKKRREAGKKQKEREEERRQLGEDQRARNADRAASQHDDAPPPAP